MGIMIYCDHEYIAKISSIYFHLDDPKVWIV